MGDREVPRGRPAEPEPRRARAEPPEPQLALVRDVVGIAVHAGTAFAVGEVVAPVSVAVVAESDRLRGKHESGAKEEPGEPFETHPLEALKTVSNNVQVPPFTNSVQIVAAKGGAVEGIDCTETRERRHLAIIQEHRHQTTLRSGPGKPGKGEERAVGR